MDVLNLQSNFQLRVHARLKDGCGRSFFSYGPFRKSSPRGIKWENSAEFVVSDNGGHLWHQQAAAYLAALWLSLLQQQSGIDAVAAAHSACSGGGGWGGQVL